MNVPVWLTHSISLLLVASLSGCAHIWPWGHRDPEPTSVVTQPVERTPLNLEAPAPLRLRSVQWIVVTPQNAEQVFRQLEAKGSDPVLFAISDDDYTSLAESMSQVRNFMNIQRNIIIEYKKYYEGTPVQPQAKP